MLHVINSFPNETTCMFGSVNAVGGNGLVRNQLIMPDRLTWTAKRAAKMNLYFSNTPETRSEQSRI